MKKLFSVVSIALLSIFSANAQRFGFEVAAGSANLGDNDVYENTLGAELNFKCDFNLKESKIGNLFLESGVGAAMKGGSYNDGDETLNLFYVQLPVQIGYNFKINDWFSIAPKAGLYAAYAVAGYDSESDCNPFTTSKTEFEDMRKFDMGFACGVNFNFLDRYQVGLNYKSGFVNIQDLGIWNIASDIRNNTVMGSFAILF